MNDHRLLRWTAETGATRARRPERATAAGTSTTWSSTGTGRAYAGNFGFDLMGGADPAPAALIRVDPDGTASVAAEDLRFPNGSVITPDGSTLIVGETAGARYTAFTIAGRRLADRPAGLGAGRADAGAHDARGDAGPAAVRARRLRAGRRGAHLGRRRVRRAVRARGRRAARSSTRSPRPEGLGFFACMLGGDDGRTLLMCAAPDFDEHTPRAGARGGPADHHGRRPARRPAVGTSARTAPVRRPSFLGARPRR